MINDKLLRLKDSLWGPVALAARTVGISDKQGGLRALHVQLYDQATTERECQDIAAQALKQVPAEALLKEPTAEEKLATLGQRIAALETQLATRAR